MRKWAFLQLSCQREVEKNALKYQLSVMSLIGILKKKKKRIQLRSRCAYSIYCSPDTLRLSHYYVRIIPSLNVIAVLGDGSLASRPERDVALF